MSKCCLQEWIDLKAQIRDLTEKLHEAEACIYTEFYDSLNPDGSRTLESNGFKVTVTNSVTVKVDQEKAALTPSLFKVKYEFSKKNYGDMTDSEKKIIDDAIEIKNNKPNFKVEKL